MNIFKHEVKGAAHEGAALAGHPNAVKSMYSGGIGTALGISTASGVGTYQINRKLARVQGDTPPPISATSGTSPGISVDNVHHAANAVHQRTIRKSRKGGK